MSEEEKKAVIFLKHFLEDDDDDDDDDFKISNKDLKIILNLIEKQQNKIQALEKQHDYDMQMIDEVKGNAVKWANELEQKEQIIKRLEQDVEGYRDLSKQIQADYSKQIREYEEGYNE